MQEKLYCRKCSKEIQNKEELCVVTEKFHLVTYHGGCYAKDKKSGKAIVLGKPLNTVNSTVKSMIALIVSIICAVGAFKQGVIEIGVVLVILSILIVYFRYYIWSKYEK